jgi:hypothetical protein
MIKDKKNIITRMMQSPEDFLAIGISHRRGGWQ